MEHALAGGYPEPDSTKYSQALEIVRSYSRNEMPYTFGHIKLKGDPKFKEAWLALGAVVDRDARKVLDAVASAGCTVAAIGKDVDKDDSASCSWSSIAGHAAMGLPTRADKSAFDRKLKEFAHSLRPIVAFASGLVEGAHSAMDERYGKGPCSDASLHALIHRLTGPYSAEEERCTGAGSHLYWSSCQLDIALTKAIGKASSLAKFFADEKAKAEKVQDGVVKSKLLTSTCSFANAKKPDVATKKELVAYCKVPAMPCKDACAKYMAFEENAPKYDADAKIAKDLASALTGAFDGADTAKAKPMDFMYLLERVCANPDISKEKLGGDCAKDKFNSFLRESYSPYAHWVYKWAFSICLDDCKPECIKPDVLRALVPK